MKNIFLMILMCSSAICDKVIFSEGKHIDFYKSRFIVPRELGALYVVINSKLGVFRFYEKSKYLYGLNATVSSISNNYIYSELEYNNWLTGDLIKDDAGGLINLSEIKYSASLGVSVGTLIEYGFAIQVTKRFHLISEEYEKHSVLLNLIGIQLHSFAIDRGGSRFGIVSYISYGLSPVKYKTSNLINYTTDFKEEDASDYEFGIKIICDYVLMKDIYIAYSLCMTKSLLLYVENNKLSSKSFETLLMHIGVGRAFF